MFGRKRRTNWQEIARERLRQLDNCRDTLREVEHQRETVGAEANRLRGTLAAYRRLVETALHLRQHGEYAPGGTENWRDWDRDAEATLRAALDGDGQKETTNAD